MMKKNVLFIVENPEWISAINSSFYNLLEHIDGNRYNVFLLFENKSDDKLIYYQGVPKKNQYQLGFFLDTYTIKRYKQTMAYRSVLFFSFQKIINKLLFILFQYPFYEVHLLKKYIIKVIKKKDIDVVFSISNSNKVRVRCLFGLHRLCKDIRCFWYELPENIKNRIFYKKVTKNIDINFIRSCDYHFFKNSLAPTSIKIMEFPQSLNRPIFQQLREHNKKIGYFGAFHKNIREPFLFLDLVKNIHDVEVDIWTSNDNFYKLLGDYELPKNIHIFEEVDYKTFSNIIFQYDLLVNVENKNTELKPSKLQTYLSTGLPILSIGIPDINLHKKLLDNYSYLCIDDKDDIATSEARLISFIQTCYIVPQNDIEEKFKEYSSSFIVDTILK